MGSTHHSLHYHLVFSTKDREPFISPSWRPRLHQYLGGTVRGLGGKALTVGGVEDHVHILASLSPAHRLSDFMRELKRSASVWASENHQKPFAWQDGYGAFSVSPTHKDALNRYIANQEAHHHRVGFRAELLRLLEVNEVDFNPEYL